jgi:hypothetical protein
MSTRATIIIALAVVLLLLTGWLGAKIERAAWLPKEHKWEADRAALDAQIAALNLAASAATSAARAREQAMQTQLTEAKANAANREKTLRAAADAADRAARGLRGDITAALNRLSGSAAAAGDRNHAAALAALGDCADRYSKVAGDADRCETDRTTLIEAWPR